MDNTKTEVERYAELAIEEAENLNRLATGEPVDQEWWEDSGLGLQEETDVLDALNNNALEVYANAHISADGRKDIQGIVVVLGTGGPHYEFEVDYKGRTEGRAYWGGEQATKVAYDLDALGEYLVEIFGGWDS